MNGMDGWASEVLRRVDCNGLDLTEEARESVRFELGSLGKGFIYTFKRNDAHQALC